MNAGLKEKHHPIYESKVVKLSAAFSYCRGLASCHSREICYKPSKICSTFSFWNHNSQKSSENDSEFRKVSEWAWIPVLFLPTASTEQDRDLLRISAQSTQTFGATKPKTLFPLLSLTSGSVVLNFIQMVTQFALSERLRDWSLTRIRVRLLVSSYLASSPSLSCDSIRNHSAPFLLWQSSSRCSWDDQMTVLHIQHLLVEWR